MKPIEQLARSVARSQRSSMKRFVFTTAAKRELVVYAQSKHEAAEKIPLRIAALGRDGETVEVGAVTSVREDGYVRPDGTVATWDRSRLIVDSPMGKPPAK